MNLSSVCVIGLQLVAWSLVSGLLFYRGLTHLCMSSPAVDKSSSNFTEAATWNSTDRVRDKGDDKGSKKLGYTSGVVMLTIACLMVVMGPICLAVKTAERCRQRKTFTKVPLEEEDKPPRYEEVMAAEEKAPSYSTLFLNSDPDPELAAPPKV